MCRTQVLNQIFKLNKNWHILIKNAYCILSLKTASFTFLSFKKLTSLRKPTSSLENLNLWKMESTKFFGAVILILVLISGVAAILLSLYRAYRSLHPREKPRVAPEEEFKNIIGWNCLENGNLYILNEQKMAPKVLFPVQSLSRESINKFKKMIVTSSNSKRKKKQNLLN